MNRLLRIALSIVLAGWVSPVWAHSEHGTMGGGDHDEAAEATSQGQTLTGEVVDVFCYLSHGKEGLGAGHAGCAKKCIQSGLPVAIKVGDQLYLAAMDSHDPANAKLAALAGQQVTVHGTVMEKDGQHLVSISRIEKAN